MSNIPSIIADECVSLGSKNSGSVEILEKILQSPLRSNNELLVMINFKGRHFPKDLIIMAVRWKIAYPLSYHNIEELMEERGADLDHSTVQKWVAHYAPLLELAFRKRKKAVGKSWKMDDSVPQKAA